MNLGETPCMKGDRLVDNFDNPLQEIASRASQSSGNSNGSNKTGGLANKAKSATLGANNALSTVAQSFLDPKPAFSKKKSI